MANQVQKVLGTEVIMMAAGSSGSLSDGAFAECAQNTFGTTQIAGYPMATFELDTAAGGFSAAPTAGAIFNLYERKKNSDGNQAPVVDASYKGDYIGTFLVDPADAQQFLSLDAPIHYYGATFYVEWLDGGAGVASVDAGWELRVIPWTLQPAA